MGISFWEPLQFRSGGSFQPTPTPLLNDTTIVEAPVALDTLAKRYAAAAVAFIHEAAAEGKPFLLYMAFNHVHLPNSAGPQFCGASKQGALGDAVEEMDWMMGQILAALEQTQRSEETITFYTSDNGHPVHNDPNGNHPLRDGKDSTWEARFRSALATVPGVWCLVSGVSCLVSGAWAGKLSLKRALELEAAASPPARLASYVACTIFVHSPDPVQAHAHVSPFSHLPGIALAGRLSHAGHCPLAWTRARQQDEQRHCAHHGHFPHHCRACRRPRAT